MRRGLGPRTLVRRAAYGSEIPGPMSYLTLLARLSMASTSAVAAPAEEVVDDFKGGPSGGQNPITALIVEL